ncbi:hypothetical protein BDV96DRAFT_651041 [Lophiotrema nucula]|uniref:Uncharacterized protein n=1 Tax=Lophiotrema nucula TaxID=690887 RepID=A0A6A5YTR0_9PLEO|nr:hypothetical protein BDV96DRAFT_651041 [Lophiotrema nucula]
MASSKTAVDTNSAHNQLQSPLFGKLPAEIRNEIFELALQEYEDPERPYEKDTYYTRPGFTGRKRIDVALMQTCKLAYAEARMVPFKSLELSFYLGNSSRVPGEYRRNGPPRRGAGSDCHEALGNEHLSMEQWSAIKHVHIFPQLYAFNGASIASRFGNRKDFKPSVVTITIRYADWWYWENNRKLELMNLRTHTITWPDSVEKIVMEFETREGKRKELEHIIKEIMDDPAGWQYSRENTGPLCIDRDEGVKEWNWDGPTTFGGTTSYPHHGDKDSMAYVVKALTWKPAPVEEDDDDN